MDAITTAAGNAALMKICDGTRPAGGGTITNVLATFTMASPFAPAAASGVLSPTLPSNTTGAAAAGTGTAATWARLTKADGTYVMDFDVTHSSGAGPLKLDNVSIATSQVVAMTAFTITAGNAS